MLQSLRLALSILALATIGLAPIIVTPGRAQDVTFSHPEADKDASAIEALVKALGKTGTGQQTGTKATTRPTRASAEALLRAGDAAGAARQLTEVLAADPADGEAWLLLAKAQLAVRPDPMMPADTPQRRSRATGAALLAAQKLKAKPRQAEAYAVLAEALKAREMWAPAIEALKVSLALEDNAQRKALLETLRAEHGFRVVDYKVETTGTEPRVCLKLSEKIGTTDVAKFIAVDGRDPQAVTAEDERICIDGLAYGKRYTVTVKADLPSDSGDALVRSAEIQVAIRDRSPSVRFSGRAYVLPSRGQTGIPVVSINVDKVAIEIYRLGDRMLAPTLQSGDFLRQLDGEQIEQIRSRTGVKVYAGTLEVTPRANEEVTTAVPLGDAVPSMKPGLYVMIASRIGVAAESYEMKATQWFVVSDLGVSALSGEDGIHAFVRSLATTDPVSGARVKLVAKNNEVLGEGRADANGYVHFAAGLKRGEGGMAPAVLVAEAGEGDYAFLDLTSAAFDLSDRGVSGRDVPGPVDAFLYAERGVYRPGEEVNLTALVRDRAGRASLVPTTLVVTRPDGVEARRVTLLDQGLGGRLYVHRLGGSSMTGTWRARLYTDPKAPAIAQLSFLVEDFVPERVDLKIDADGVTLLPGEERDIKIAGRYLYGPPAGGLTIEGDIVVKAATGDLPGFPGFRFGNALEKVAPARSQLEDLPNTDESGNAIVSVKLPAIPRTARPLEADVLIRLREAGGRAIERKVTLPVLTGKSRIGIKGLFSGAGVDEGETASFEALMIDAENKLVPAPGLKWELYALDQRWQWFSRDGSWQFEPVTTSRRVGNGTAAAAAGAERVRIDVPRLEWGRYRLDVSTTESGGPVSSYVFNAGWYSADGPDSPETLDIALDKPVYKAGETAKVRIVSRFAGRAQIAVISNGLLAQKVVDVKAGGTEATLDVGEGWLPGAYVAVTLFRPMDEAQRRMPARSVGIRWLGVDASSRKLEVSLAAPAKTKPGTRLSVPVKLGGLAPGEKARLTLAAIDAGILGVTRYEPPKPESHFLGQRRLGVEMRDLYGRLIDGMRAERGRLRSGGDGDVAAKPSANPPVEKLLALFSGIVTVGADGTAVVDFDLPEFNGTVRLMAVAWSESKVGSGTQDVIVRDAVALTVAAPRFLMLGDATRIRLDIHNVEGEAGQYAVTVARRDAAKAPAEPPAMLTLKAGERTAHVVKLEPKEIGLSIYDVRVTGPGGVDVRRDLTFDVKAPHGDIRRVSVVKLKPKGGRLELAGNILDGLVPGTVRAAISAGPAAGFDLPGLLASLDTYPYGCAEQTTSRALPLLYSAEMARRIGLTSDADIKKRVQAAIDRLAEMQDSSGAFGLWGPGSPDLWLTSYVTDFLTRAKEAGYDVRAEVISQALDRLANFTSNVTTFEGGGESRAYAHYVLARSGRGQVGELRYLADSRLERFATALAQAHLGAALSMVGEKERAERVIRAAIARLDGTAVEVSRLDYGSRLRDGAALVTLVAETGVAKAEVPRLMTLVSRAFTGRTYTSTQEQAWLLLAARALAEDARALSLVVGSTPHAGPLSRRIGLEELGPRPLVVENRGEGEVEALVSVRGASLTAEPSIERGFAIERSYYTLDGQKVELKSATGGTASLKQNERLVVVVKVTLREKEKGGRLLLVDRLPAGLEIENARLVDSGSVKALDWLKRAVEPTHTEFRDDRFVASFDVFKRRRGGDDGDNKVPDTLLVAYIVRAVTPGSFTHPAATVEDMYQPERHARTATGRLTVTEAR